MNTAIAALPTSLSTTNDDPELDIADWIDEQNGKCGYSPGSIRSIMLK